MLTERKRKRKGEKRRRRKKKREKKRREKKRLPIITSKRPRHNPYISFDPSEIDGTLLTLQNSLSSSNLPGCGREVGHKGEGGGGREGGRVGATKGWAGWGGATKGWAGWGVQQKGGQGGGWGQQKGG